jgi:hypothetical protein
MGIRRIDDVAYLSQEYATLEELTEVAPADSSQGYKAVITSARFRLTSDYDDARDPTFELEPAPDDERWYDKHLALLRFEALTKFKSLLAPRVSWQVAGDGVNPHLSIAFDQVAKLLADVVAELYALGIIVGPVPPGEKIGAKIRTMSFDIYEPKATEM